MNATLLLQRQMESAGSFRKPVNSPSDLVETHQIVKQLYDFMNRMNRITAKLELPVEASFQCLMHLGMGKVEDFDKQARDGSVPMHQAKVLDSNSALKSLEVEPALRKMVSGEELDQLVSNCSLLRSFLRMKVEDGNDLSMARKMVSLTMEYLDTIKHYSDGDAAKMYLLYTAETEEAVDEAINSSNAMESTVGSAGFGSTIGTFEGTLSRTSRGKPAPTDAHSFMAGVKTEVAKLESGKNSVGERQAALQALLGWVQEVDQEIVDDVFEPLVTLLSTTLRVHLSEKRSLLLKIACNIASFLLIRCRPELIADTPSQSKVVRDAVVMWLDCLLKGVHVTVAAIARATDETVRDLVVVSYGSSSVVRKLFATLQAAQQPELRKRVLNYLSVCLLSARPEACDEFVREGTLIMRLLSQGDAQTRRAARLLVGVARVQGVDIMFGNLDPKTAKALESEEKEVRDMGSSVEAFELNVLRYEEPSKACLYWDLCRLENCPTSPHSGTAYSPPSKRSAPQPSVAPPPAPAVEQQQQQQRRRPNMDAPLPPTKTRDVQRALPARSTTPPGQSIDAELPWESTPQVLDTVAHLCSPTSPSPDKNDSMLETPERRAPVAGRRQGRTPDGPAVRRNSAEEPIQPQRVVKQTPPSVAPSEVRKPPVSIYATKAARGTPTATTKAPLHSRPSSGGVPLSLSGIAPDIIPPRQRTPAEMLTSLKRRSSSTTLQ